MSDYAEAHGSSLKELREKKKKHELHHLRIHAHPDGTPDKPRWIVAHHMSEDDPSPKEYDFSDGNEMLGHIASAASAPEAGQEAGQEEEG